MNKILGSILILLGLMFFLFFGQIISLIIDSIYLHLLAIVYSVYSFYKYSSTNNHIKIFLSVCSFLLLVVFFVNANFRIVDSNEMFLVSAIAIPAVGFVYLFVSDLSQTSFLLIGVSWLVIGVIVNLIITKSILILLLDNFLNVFLSAVPFLLIAFGVLKLIKKEKSLLEKTTD